MNSLHHLKQGILAAIACVGLICAATAPAFAECALSLGWEPWEPYQYHDGQKLTGLDIDLVVTIFERVGCQVSLQEVPWARSLNLVEHGKIDGVMGASKTAEREAYANFSQPYRAETMALFVRKGESAKFPLAAIADFAKTPFNLGVVRGYFYGDAFQELAKNPDMKKYILEADNEEENYAKILKNRIDGFLSDPFVTAAGLRKAGLSDQIETHPAAVYSNDIYVMFSKKSTTPQQVELFNQGLEAVKADGAYQKIVDRYLQK